MLVHYYTDIKRQIPAKLSRQIDKDIRDLCHDKPELSNILRNCKNVAEAEKARLRRKEQKRFQAYRRRPLTGAEHIPCRERKPK